MAERNKLLNWWKLWHPFKKSTADDSAGVSSSTQNHPRHANPGFWHALSRYGRVGWTQHWSISHLDKKSCTHMRDVCQKGSYKNQNQKQGIIQAHVPQLLADKTDNSLHRRNLVTGLIPDESLAKGSVLHVNVKEGAGRSSNRDFDISNFDGQQHKLGLRNRVLPLTIHEDMCISTACKLKSSLFSVDEERPMPGIFKEMDLANMEQKRSLSYKKPGFSRFSSTPVSPRYPPETKWRMHLSCSSQSNSPRSPLCLQGFGWNGLAQENIFRKGSLSTMGSPWNLQVGGISNQTNRASFLKGLHKQGQWVTTDSDFVVLEL